MGRSGQVGWGLAVLVAAAGVAILLSGATTTRENAPPSPEIDPSADAAPTPTTGPSDTDPTVPFTGTVSPVVSDFTVSISQGEAPLTVRFRSTATTASGGEVMIYEWVFGDGLEDTGSEVAHTFQAPDTYEVRLTVTDSLGFLASRSQLITVTGQGDREIVDYVLDPGFEVGNNGFENYYDTSTSQRINEGAITGDASLQAHLPGWSNLILSIAYPFAEGPRGYLLTASADVRVDEMTPDTGAELCAVAYWDSDGEEARFEACVGFSGATAGTSTVEARLVLDSEEQLSRVYLWISYPSDGDAIVTIDNAHLILEQVPGSGGV